MKYEDFQIVSIELSHDKAIELKERCIDTINYFGINNFEGKETEVEIKTENIEPITVYLKLTVFTEMSEPEQPFSPDIISRSIHGLRIQLINQIGDEVQFTVLGQRKISEHSGRWITCTPIDIEEEIVKHFTI